MDEPVPKNQTLSQIANDVFALEGLILERMGELSPEIEAWLTEIATNLGDKADNYKFAMDRFGSTAEMLKAKAAEFQKAAKAVENVGDRLKQRIKDVMIATGRTEVTGENYRFKVSPSKPKLVIHEHLVPVHFKDEVVTYEINKERIKTEYDAGAIIPGVTVEPVHALRITVNKGI